MIQHGSDGLADPGGSGVAQEHDAVVDADVAGTEGATGEWRVDDEQGAKAKAEQGERNKEHGLRKAHRHDDECDDGDDKADEQRLIGAELVDDLAKGQTANQVGAGVDGDHHTAEGDGRGARGVGEELNGGDGGNLAHEQGARGGGKGEGDDEDPEARGLDHLARGEVAEGAGMCATLGGLEALGQPAGLGGLQE